MRKRSKQSQLREIEKRLNDIAAHSERYTADDYKQLATRYSVLQQQVEAERRIFSPTIHEKSEIEAKTRLKNQGRIAI